MRIIHTCFWLSPEKKLSGKLYEEKLNLLPQRIVAPYSILMCFGAKFDIYVMNVYSFSRINTKNAMGQIIEKI